MNNNRISLSVIITILLFLLWQLTSLVLSSILILVIAFYVTIALAPVVDAAQKAGLSRLVAVLMIYASLAAILAPISIIVSPMAAQQIQQLIDKTPVYLETLRSLLSDMILRFGMDDTAVTELINQLIGVVEKSNHAASSSKQYSLNSRVLSTLFPLLLSAYMVFDYKQLLENIIELFPTPWKNIVSHFVPSNLFNNSTGEIIRETTMGLSILITVITFGLKLLGLSEFALGLGVIAGFGYLFPFFGSLLGAVPALIVAISQGGLTFVWVLLLFIIVRNLGVHLITTYLLNPLRIYLSD